ncbi:MAG: hypothetical protein U5L11_04475 [Arhodomonas sp.]|nr:hypothetical protein [Arhodomonas sp.]
MSTDNAEAASAPSAEVEEARQLEYVRGRLQAHLEETEARLRRYSRDIQDQKTYLWESRDEMDHIEKISARESIEQSVRSGDMHARQAAGAWPRAWRSPYFGRFDFSAR